MLAQKDRRAGACACRLCSDAQSSYQSQSCCLTAVVVDGKIKKHANEFDEVRIVIGTTVKVIVDRPLGTCHPKHQDIIYPINYGYVPGVMAQDGEEQDAYILGVCQPIKEFVGKVIAIIHRLDDVEEKWVVAPEDILFTKDEIAKQVAFQEQYFQAEIRM